jgi:predicted permease
LPLTWKGGTNGIEVEGQPRLASMSYDAADRVISSGYMETMGMTLLDGRFFDDRDRAGAAPVTIINATMARQYWPDASPIGRRLRIGGDASPSATIVGVVADTPDMGIESPPKATTYFPVAQSAGNWMWPRDLVVRASGDPIGLVPSVTAAVRAVDRHQPVSNIETMDDVIARELADQTIEAALFSVFALLALVLAAVGIFGVLSYAVTERTAEIGVRLALGGEPQRIRWLFVRRGLGMAAAGLVAGLTIAAWATSLIERLLFHVQALDPAVFATNAGVLLAVCIMAAYLPARRASRVDPIQALRSD